MSRENLFKEWFEVSSDEEWNAKEMELRNKGYDLFDIYRFGYQGNDGRYHREIFVFNR